MKPKYSFKEKIDAINSNSYKSEYNLEIHCPACGKMIKNKAIRCKYCKTNLNEYINSPEYYEKLNEELKELKKKKSQLQMINFKDENIKLPYENSRTNGNYDNSDKSWKALFTPDNENAKKETIIQPKESETHENNHEKNSVKKSPNNNHSKTKNIKHENTSDEFIGDNELGEKKPWYYTASPSTNTKAKQPKPKISKLSTSPTKIIKNKRKVNSKPKYQSYKFQANKLQSKFKLKEKNLRKLIEKCFPSPQMTNSKFNYIVDYSSEIFDSNMKSIMLIIDSANDYSPKLENEIKSDIDVLKQIINKLDSLHEELLIQMSKSDDDDFENLSEEMDMLIDSIKDYNFDNKT